MMTITTLALNRAIGGSPKLKSTMFDGRALKEKGS